MTHAERAAPACETCQGHRRVTYDGLPPWAKERVGFGSVFPCPICEPAEFDRLYPKT